MGRKKRRSCVDCIAYCNMLGDEDNRCGLGFHVMEDIEGGDGTWTVVVFPFENECEGIDLPRTKEEFVRIAASRGIDWKLDEVADSNDIY